jgi:transposase
VTAISLSPGQAHDALDNRKLLRQIGARAHDAPLLMDRACEGEEPRPLALESGYSPVVSPKRNRVTAWDYDRAMYRRRNEVERLFRRLKGFRRIFSRFGKLDSMFRAFIHFGAKRRCR